jgi:hypothetical protein
MSPTMGNAGGPDGVLVQDITLAVLTGLEPATSALTGNATEPHKPPTSDFADSAARYGTNNPRAYQHFVP